MPEVADLWVSLRAITAPFTEAMAAAGVAGERAAVQFKALQAEVSTLSTRMTAFAGEADVAATALVRLSAESESATAGLAASSGEGARASEQFAALEATVTTTGQRLEALGVSADAAATGLATASTEARAAAASMSATAAGAGEAGAAVEGLGAKAAGMGASIGKGVVVGTVALAAVGVEAIHMASTFESSTTRLVTSAGESVKNIDMVRKGLLNMAGQVGVSADELSSALYFVDAAGYRAADGLTVLKAAAQGAAAEGADTTTVVKALTDILVDYHLPASAAANVTSQMIAAVAHGKTTLQEFSGAFASIVPAASAAGISYQDVTAALAQMTNHGFTAARASQNLAQALRSMLNPTNTMASAFAEYGVSSDVLKQKLAGANGLTDAMQYLSEAATKAGAEGTTAFAAALKRLMGTAPGANAALATVGANFAATAETIDAVGKSTADASGKVAGFALVQQTLGQQLKEIKYGFESLMITIGEFLIPYVSKAITAIETFGRGAVKGIGELWTVYGQTVKDKLAAAAGYVETGAKAMLVPLKEEFTSVAIAAIPLAITAVEKFQQRLRDVTDAARPVVTGLHDMYVSATSSGGALDTLGERLKAGAGLLAGLTGGLGEATTLLRPLGELIGGVAHAFSELPGPIQLSVLGMIAMRPFRSQIQDLQGTVVGYGRSAVDSFNGVRGAIQTQAVLAEQAGVSIGRWGASFAALEAHVPVIGAMATSFRTTSAAIEESGGRLAGFRGAIGGVATAVGTGAKVGLMGAMSGLYSFLGGPWGIAIGGAMYGLDLLAKSQQAAAAAAEAHRQRVATLAQALQQSKGQIDANVRSTVVQTLADTKLAGGKTLLIDVMRKAGVSVLDLTNAYLGQSGSVDALHTRLLALAQANTTFTAGKGSSEKVLTAQGQAYKDAADALGSLNGELPTAITRSKDMAAAVAGSASAVQAATDPTGRLKKVIDTLTSSESTAEDKANALNQALRLLSGGMLDVQAAVAQQNAAITDLNGAWRDNLDASKGYGASLLQASGAINTTTENGQALFTKLQSLTEQTATAAQASYDFAKVNGATVPDALRQAEGAMQTSWEAAVTGAQKLGLTADQARNLAAQMGLIPSNLAITLAVKDLNPTQQAMLYVQGLADHLQAGATVKISALPDEAIRALNDVGVRTQSLPGGFVQITVPNREVAAKLAAIDAMQLSDKYVGVHLYTVNGDQYAHGFADGGIVQRFADGGVLHAADGMTVPGYAPRRDIVPALLSPGEGVLVPEAVRAIGGAPAITAINRSARSGTGGLAAGRSTDGLAVQAPAGGGGQTVVVNVTVQGSVLSERDLRDVMQQQMLRLGMRSATSYQPYARR
jgi:TP901 family phage tail tape measure protein